ncbi:SM-like, degradation of cytoplasmic mRNAs and positively regulates transcription initiation [Ascosphaera aggregata]|nr:SM-like, degradation of cytoplasmic mRNAs and positively regulates transcription initiation [Ascosphaera aggregata]
MPPPSHPPPLQPPSAPPSSSQQHQQSSQAVQTVSQQHESHPSLLASQPPPQPPPPAPPSSLPTQPGPTGMLPPVMPMSMSMPMPMPPPAPPPPPPPPPHAMPPHSLSGTQMPIRTGPPPPGHAQPGPRGQQQHQQLQQESEDDGGLPQLPPQMFTTAAQLLDLTDTNLVLQDTVEKIYAGNFFAEQKRGIYIVRGENVLLLGEIDLDKEDELPANYQQGEWKHVLALKEKEDAERKKLNTSRGKQLHDLGFEAEHSGEVLF